MKQYCLISAVVFGVVAVMHLYRVIQGWTAMVGPYDLPMSLSIAAIVIAGGLSVAGFSLARR